MSTGDDEGMIAALRALLKKGQWVHGPVNDDGTVTDWWATDRAKINDPMFDSGDLRLEFRIRLSKAEALALFKQLEEFDAMLVTAREELARLGEP